MDADSYKSTRAWSIHAGRKIGGRRFGRIDRHVGGDIFVASACAAAGPR